MENPTTPTVPAQEPVTPAEPAPEPQRREPPEENLVGEAVRKQRAAEKEAQDYKKRLETLEDKDRSETERAQRRAETAEQEAKDLRERTETLEKGSWLRSAASQANFHDPDDAVARAKLADIESERDAKRFVENLAKDAKHLVKAEEQGPQIGQVLRAGERTEPTPQNEAQQAEVARARGFADTLQRLSSDWQ